MPGPIFHEDTGVHPRPDLEDVMGRSYSQYPFQSQQPMLGVQGSGARLGNDEDTQKVAQQEASTTTPGGDIGYGRKNAETVRRYRARAAKRASGGGARKTGAAKKAAPAARKAAPAAKAAPVKKAATKKTAAKKASAKTAMAKPPTRGTKAAPTVSAAAKRSTVSKVATTATTLAKKLASRVTSRTKK
jgi:hypothetical protein